MNNYGSWKVDSLTYLLWYLFYLTVFERQVRSSVTKQWHWLHVFVQLEVFLTQRLSEMGEEDDVVAMSQFQLAPSVIQSQTCEHIREMLSEVQDLLGRLTSLRMQHLFMIQASPRYAAITDRIIVSLYQFQSAWIHKVIIFTRHSMESNVTLAKIQKSGMKIFLILTYYFSTVYKYYINLKNISKVVQAFIYFYVYVYLLCILYMLSWRTLSLPWNQKCYIN